MRRCPKTGYIRLIAAYCILFGLVGCADPSAGDRAEAAADPADQALQTRPRVVPSDLEAANEAFRARRYEEAERRFRELLRQAAGPPLAEERLAAYHGLIRVLISRGSYQEAADHLAALSAECGGAPGCEARRAHLAASRHHRLGDQKAAEAEALESIRLAELAGAADVLADARSMLANVYSLLGRHQDAARIHEQSLAAERRGSDPQRLATALNNLAIDYRHLGRYRAAIPLFEESAEVSRAAKDTESEARALYNLGLLYSVNGDLDRAITMIRRASELVAQIGNAFGMGITADALGQLYGHAGNFERARDYQLRAIRFNAAAKQAYGEVGSTGALGVLERKMGRLDESAAHLTRAVALSETNGLAEPGVEFRIELALTRSLQERHDEALALIETAEAQARAQAEASLQFAARAARASIVERLGRAEEATALYLESIDALEGWRGKLDFDDLSMNVADRHAGIFEGAIRGLVLQGREPAAFEVAERARARALLHAMVGRPGPVAVSNARLQPAAQGVAAARDVLRAPGAAMLAFFWGEQHVYGWFLDAEGVRAMRLGDSAELGALVEFVRLAAADGTSELDWRPAARAAYRALIAPLAEAVPERLVVIPDGPLARLPFEVLVADGSGQPLGARTRITYGPSSSVLAALRHRRMEHAAGAMLSLGYSPDGRDSRYPKIRHAPGEARAVARILGREDSRHIIGSGATLQRWLEAKPGAYRMLHLATHAMLDDRHPDNSHLLFADGRLDLARIRALQLSAQLVSLSACETALGREYRGEGLVGFSHAFLAAGAQALLASHWPVADHLAADFMTSFYERLAKGEAIEDALLHVRKAWMLEDDARSHPAAWGAFVLIGAPPARPIA
jgi:CHAT domain-containing protein